MPSQLITPPDQIIEHPSYLIINAVDAQVESLVIYLKTTNKKYNIHLWHVEMEEEKWVLSVAQQVDLVLYNAKFERFIVDPLLSVLTDRFGTVVSFGEEEDYKDLVDFFLKQSDNET